MKIKIDKTKQNTISPYIFMQFAEPLGTSDSSVDAAWDFIKDDWREPVVEKINELSPTMIRWGGCFASYYHWKEAVGKQSERKPMLNLLWDGVYSNMVGTREICELCERVGAEPLMVVNMESDGRMYWAYPKEGENRLGTAEEAAEWVDYCNNPDNELRISHGRKQPYNIKFWQIGNETSYERGFSSAQTAQKTAEFADAMRKVDPSIKLIAWGDGCKKLYGDENWVKPVCDAAADKIDYIAFHHHFDSGLPDSVLNDFDYRKDVKKTWAHFMNAHRSLEKKIADMREKIKGYPVRLAMTEGHFGLMGRNRCDALSSWGAGVAYARNMLVIERNTDILDIATQADFFGNRWQVNALMIPTPSIWGNPYLQPVGHIMKLFRHHIGDYALKLPENIDGVDLFASVSEDGKSIFVHAVNTSMDESKELDFDLDGEIKSARAYYIAADPTTEITHLNPTVFDIAEAEFCDKFILAPAAVAAIEIKIK